MLERLFKPGPTDTQREPPSTLVSTGRWENEGGARPDAASVAGMAPGLASDASALDSRQDAVMAVISSDGRPPTHRQRTFDWRMLAIGAGLVIVGFSVWIAVKGVSVFAVVTGMSIGVLLLVGASPVLAAGVLRGKEERAARTIVRLERRGRRDR
ncbi:MAG TPA: hypothetical protein PKE29_02455 [Phycisphaerales bacterium]|nr:hypothetical protein [Phycisphaerales bacterium]